MSKARSPRGVDSMTMGTRPDIVASGREGEEAAWGGGGKGGDQEEEEEEEKEGEKGNGDGDEEVRGRRRLKLDESDGIAVLIDAPAGKPLRAPAAAAAAASRAASSTAPRLIEQFFRVSGESEASGDERSRERGREFRLQSNFFFENSDLF